MCVRCGGEGANGSVRARGGRPPPPPCFFFFFFFAAAGGVSAARCCSRGLVARGWSSAFSQVPSPELSACASCAWLADSGNVCVASARGCVLVGGAVALHSRGA
jgi:hypothetical protein